MLKAPPGVRPIGRCTYRHDRQLLEPAASKIAETIAGPMGRSPDVVHTMSLRLDRPLGRHLDSRLIGVGRHSRVLQSERTAPKMQQFGGTKDVPSGIRTKEPIRTSKEKTAAARPKQDETRENLEFLLAVRHQNNANVEKPQLEMLGFVRRSLPASRSKRARRGAYSDFHVTGSTYLRASPLSVLGPIAIGPAYTEIISLLRPQGGLTALKLPHLIIFDGYRSGLPKTSSFSGAADRADAQFKRIMAESWTIQQCCEIAGRM
jgi:hypothetical protein